MYDCHPEGGWATHDREDPGAAFTALYEEEAVVRGRLTRNIWHRNVRHDQVLFG